MKRLFVPFLVALAGFVAPPASAQLVVRPNLFQNPLVLVENLDVQKDLKFSDEQARKIVELSRAYAEAIRGVGFTAADIEKRTKATAAAVKGLGDTLTAEQGKRMNQLELQQRGANAFNDAQIAKQLAITPDQRGAIITVLQGFNPKWIAIIQGAKGNQQEIQKKLAEAHRDYSADIVKRLTAEQQAKWQGLAGPPFAGSFPFMQPVFVDPRPQPVLNWHMNDLPGALAEAKKTGKPIFVTFRCEA